MKKRYFIIIIVLCLVMILMFMNNNLLSSKTEIKEIEEKILSETTNEIENNSDDDIYDVILFWGQSNMVGYGVPVEYNNKEKPVDSRLASLGIDDFSERSGIEKEIPNMHSVYVTKFIKEVLDDAKIDANDIENLMVGNGLG